MFVWQHNVQYSHSIALCGMQLKTLECEMERRMELRFSFHLGRMQFPIRRDMVHQSGGHGSQSVETTYLIN